MTRRSRGPVTPFVVAVAGLIAMLVVPLGLTVCAVVTASTLSCNGPCFVQLDPAEPSSYGRSVNKRKRNRRSISVTGATYARLHAYCESTGRSCSSVVEQLIHAHMDAAGIAAASDLEPPPDPAPLRKAQGPETTEITSQHFTF